MVRRFVLVRAYKTSVANIRPEKSLLLIFTETKNLYVVCTKGARVILKKINHITKTILCSKSKIPLSGEVLKENFTDVFYTNLEVIAFSLLMTEIENLPLIQGILSKKEDRFPINIPAKNEHLIYKPFVDNFCSSKIKNSRFRNFVSLNIKVGDYLSSGDKIGVVNRYDACRTKKRSIASASSTLPLQIEETKLLKQLFLSRRGKFLNPPLQIEKKICKKMQSAGLSQKANKYKSLFLPYPVKGVRAGLACKTKNAPLQCAKIVLYKYKLLPSECTLSLHPLTSTNPFANRTLRMHGTCKGKKGFAFPLHVDARDARKCKCIRRVRFVKRAVRIPVRECTEGAKKAKNPISKKSSTAYTGVVLACVKSKALFTSPDHLKGERQNTLLCSKAFVPLVHSTTNILTSTNRNLGEQSRLLCSKAFAPLVHSTRNSTCKKICFAKAKSLTNRTPRMHSHLHLRASRASTCKGNANPFFPLHVPCIRRVRFAKGFECTEGAKQKRGKKICKKMGTPHFPYKTPIILPSSGRVLTVSKTQLILQKTQPVLFYDSANLHVKKGEWVKEGAPILTLTHQTLITGDIVQGIPRIEQLFEAFTSPPPGLKEKKGLDVSQSKFKNVHDTLHSQVRDIFRKNWLKSVLPIAVRKSLQEIQYLIVEMIQKVYLSQGVLIADKHIEIIIRQMTSKGQILDSGSTGLLLEEVLPIRQIENANITTPGKKCLYVPAVVGLTAAALTCDSFISAASFQETTRVLSRDAVVGKSDFLRGLKEKVVIGDLISAGTGLDIYFIYTLFAE